MQRRNVSAGLRGQISRVCALAGRWRRRRHGGWGEGALGMLAHPRALLRREVVNAQPQERLGRGNAGAEAAADHLARHGFIVIADADEQVGGAELRTHRQRIADVVILEFLYGAAGCAAMPLGGGRRAARREGCAARRAAVRGSRRQSGRR